MACSPVSGNPPWPSAKARLHESRRPREVPHPRSVLGLRDIHRQSALLSVVEENLQRMKTLDDAWNAQNWEVFRKRHSADTKVYWPGQPDLTRGRDAHHAESEAFFQSIENHLDNRRPVRAHPVVLDSHSGQSLVQDDAHQGTVDGDVAVVVDEPELLELVHEEVHARARRADHLGERFLRDLGQHP